MGKASSDRRLLHFRRSGGARGATDFADSAALPASTLPNYSVALPADDAGTNSATDSADDCANNNVAHDSADDGAAYSARRARRSRRPTPVRLRKSARSVAPSR